MLFIQKFAYLYFCIFFLNLHFPTLFFTILPKFYNFHENRIFFTNLYFYTEYAILVNPNIKASLLTDGDKKKQKQAPISIYYTINKMIYDIISVEFIPLNPFGPTSNDYASTTIVLVEHKYSAQAAQHSAWSSPWAASCSDHP